MFPALLEHTFNYRRVDLIMSQNFNRWTWSSDERFFCGRLKAYLPGVSGGQSLVIASQQITIEDLQSGFAIAMLSPSQC